MKPAENSRRWRTALFRFVVTGIVLVLWFWTQSLIGARTAPATGIGDALHNLTAGLNSYFAQHSGAANGLLIVSSALIERESLDSTSIFSILALQRCASNCAKGQNELAPQLALSFFP